MTRDEQICSVTLQARAGAASVLLLSTTAAPELWPGAAVVHEGRDLVVRWTDPWCGLPVTLRLGARAWTADEAQALGDWTLGLGGLGSAVLRVTATGHRSVRLHLSVSGSTGVRAHGLHMSARDFLRRLAGVAEHRSLSS